MAMAMAMANSSELRPFGIGIDGLYYLIEVYDKRDYEQEGRKKPKPPKRKMYEDFSRNSSTFNGRIGFGLSSYFGQDGCLIYVPDGCGRSDDSTQRMRDYVEIHEEDVYSTLKVKIPVSEFTKRYKFDIAREDSFDKQSLKNTPSSSVKVCPKRLTNLTDDSQLVKAIVFREILNSYVEVLDRKLLYGRCYLSAIEQLTTFKAYALSLIENSPKHIDLIDWLIDLYTKISAYGKSWQSVSWNDRVQALIEHIGTLKINIESDFSEFEVEYLHTINSVANIMLSNRNKSEDRIRENVNYFAKKKLSSDCFWCEHSLREELEQASQVVAQATLKRNFFGLFLAGGVHAPAQPEPTITVTTNTKWVYTMQPDGSWSVPKRVECDPKQIETRHPLATPNRNHLPTLRGYDFSNIAAFLGVKES